MRSVSTLNAVICPLFVCLIIKRVTGYYLPGLPPVNYCQKSVSQEKDNKCVSDVKLYVNKLDSEESFIPYEYQDFDFCTSPYNISFLRQDECRLLCEKEYDLTRSDDIAKLKFLQKGMLRNYQHHWIIDNIPVTWCYPVDGDREYCSLGFPMGCYVDAMEIPKDTCVMSIWYNKADTFYLFNHIDLQVRYQSGSNETWGLGFGDKGGRITSVKVMPRSIRHDKKSHYDADCVQSLPPMEIPGKLGNSGKLKIYYTYSVYFIRDNSRKWSLRWDYIPKSNTESDTDWFELITRIISAILYE